MYQNTEWKDHVTDESGTVIQQGTNMSAEHFNNAEEGISDAHTAEQIRLQHSLQRERIVDDKFDDIEKEIEAEYGSVTLCNTDSYPFNNSKATVALSKVRNLHYTVEAVVTGYTGGLPGEVEVLDKAINGFKMKFDGSAATVTVDYIVKGGLMS